MLATRRQRANPAKSAPLHGPVANAEQIDSLCLWGLQYSCSRIDPHLEHLHRPDYDDEARKEPPQVYIWGSLCHVHPVTLKLSCVSVFLCSLVRPDHAAKWFQDHAEDAGGQPALPLVLGFRRLPGWHGAGGKPGDNQTHSSWDPREGSVLSLQQYIRTGQNPVGRSNDVLKRDLEVRSAAPCSQLCFTVITVQVYLILKLIEYLNTQHISRDHSDVHAQQRCANQGRGFNGCVWPQCKLYCRLGPGQLDTPILATTC